MNPLNPSENYLSFILLLDFRETKILNNLEFII